MPFETIAMIVAALLALALAAALGGLARARATAAALTRECEGLRDHRDGLDTDLRGERDAHGLARGDVARLTTMVEGLERQLASAAHERRAFAEQAHGERVALATKLDETRGEVERLKVANARLQTGLDARIAAHEKEVTLLKDLREDMANRFKALADATLEDHGTRFGTLNHERMTALLKPMSEQVERFQAELREAHTGAATDRARLKAEIEQLTRRSEEVSREAVALTNALKGEKQKQGAWGEMILERILEASGLERGLHYEVQTSRRDEDGRTWRPDVIVRMPRDKVLVIDSKVSLVDYEAGVNAADEADRALHRKAHAASMRRHIDALADKAYQTLDRNSIDYVLLFMPIEGALPEALREQGDLTTYALSRRVGIMTPTTLMVTLRTVDHIWTVERRESNAEAIADRAGKLYDKVAGFVDDMQSVTKHLTSATKAHEAAMGKLTTGNGNVLRQIDMLRDMGARTTKTITAEFDRHDEVESREDEPEALPPASAAE